MGWSGVHGSGERSGAVVLVMLGWLMALAWLGDAPEMAFIPSILAAALLGFLAFNFPRPWRDRASVFMGDAGSLMLGFAVAWFALEVAYGRAGGIPPLTVAWILGLPVFGAMSLMARRVREDHQPMARTGSNCTMSSSGPDSLTGEPYIPWQAWSS